MPPSQNWISNWPSLTVFRIGKFKRNTKRAQFAVTIIAFNRQILKFSTPKYSNKLSACFHKAFSKYCNSCESARQKWSFCWTGKGYQGFPNSIKGWVEIPPSEGEWEILLGDFFYWLVGIWGGVHLTIKTFSRLQTTFCKYWTSIKIETSMTCVCKEYKVKIKMVQGQWLQLKRKFLLGYNIKIVI